jgi:hypothetical protein
MFQQMRRGFERVAAIWNSRWTRRVTHAVRWGAPVILLAFVAYSLTKLGWAHVWEERPSAFSFYLIAFLPFFVQPIADLVIYRNLLGTRLPLSILLRKRFVNSVMDYSGEGYFFLWARKNLDLKGGVLLHAVKDTNVLSAGAALTIAWVVLVILLEVDTMRLPGFMSANRWEFVVLGSIPLALSLGLIVGGRRVTALSRRQIAMTFSIHIVRSIIALSLEFLLWWLSGALASPVACMEFVALRILITRLPFVPNKELIFVGVGIAAAHLLDASAPKVAAVLVITTAYTQLQEVVLVGVPWLFDRIPMRPSADEIAS